MKRFLEVFRAKAVCASAAALLLAGFTVSSLAQKPEARIVAPVDSGARATLIGTHPAVAQAAYDAGRMESTTQIHGASITFSKSPAQEAALETLIAAQQNPASSLYHQWLTPDQFAAQFGAADADLAQVQSWLEQQGFSIDEISRNRSSIRFSGSVAQINAAFATEMHNYTMGTKNHFAPSADLSIPAAFSPAVISIGNLSDFQPHAHSLKPNFTSSQSGSHFVQPGDVAVIYDINAAYNAGYTGAGQTIAVVGASAIVTADISNFQSASGLPAKLPTQILVPGTGTSAIISGDEAEADLDLEYSGAIAKGASIYYVYTGNNGNYGAFDSLNYAVQNRTAGIINVSFGECEIEQTGYYSSQNAIAQQAATQGQTVIASSGDSGSTGCYDFTDLTPAQEATLAVSWPATSQYVTGVGGTEYLAADVSGANAATYWTASTGTDVITSAKSYIPEMAWNDDAPYVSSSSPGGIGSGGGGVSIYTPRPTWQAGVPGIPAGSFRLVPDISLASSAAVAPYLICSSDSGYLGITGSCSNGFRDINNTNLTLIGGTSVASPIFAGMIAIINQKAAPSGQGVINSTLYTLASNASIYASAFHDITVGTNECAVNTPYIESFNSNGTPVLGPNCTAADAASFATNVGYDEATGLGSVDLFNLLTVWPAVAPLTGSSTTVTAATLSPVAGANDVITFKVASVTTSVTTVPTGTISLSIDGTVVQSLPLTNGSAVYNYSSLTAGVHVITGVYTGDSVYSTSTGTVTLTVGASTLKATLVTATPAANPAIVGTSDAITITVVGNPSSTPAPTGQVSINGTTVTLTPGTASSTAVYNYTSTVAGTASLVVAYLGDSVYQTSSSTLSLTSGSAGSFALSAPALSIATGGTGTETVTITPASGFSGGVSLTLSIPTAVTNLCYTLTNPTVSGATTVPVTIYTNGSNCTGTVLPLTKRVASNEAPATPGRSIPVGLAMAGLLALGFAGRRSRRLRGLVMVALLAVAGFGMSGCGSTDSSGTGISSNAPTGTYTITVSATDTATQTKTASTTFVLTIH